MDKKYKIAIVTDFLKVYGGLERQLEGIMDLFPNADIYTTFYVPENLPRRFKDFNIIESKYKNIFKILSSFAVPLYPIAFEAFVFEKYDVVLSISTGFGKDVNTGDIKHISYILTPPRFLWNLPNSTQDKLKVKFPIEILNNYLRLKDFTAAQGPQKLIANSKTVQSRIKKYYRRDSDVVYPFVDTNKFNITKDFSSGHSFLIISRLEKYKNLDLAIRVFNKLKLRLNIVGIGSYRKYLESISESKYIKFYGYVSDIEMVRMLNQTKALIFPGAEDFGLTPIEAQACGKPVIALKKDGVLETVIEGKTGYFFKDEIELEEIIKNFDSTSIDKMECRENSLLFSKESFSINLEKSLFHK